MTRAVDRVVTRLMGLPRLYQAVQASIAGPLHRQVRALLRAAIPDAPDLRVLDLGCGVGDYAALFRRARYHGVDRDPRYVAAARRAFAEARTTFAVGDATALAFADGSFDWCFSVGLYHHMADDAVLASLAEARRVAAPGRVLVVDAIYPPRGNWPGAFLRRIDRGKHVRTLAAYERLLREGFPSAELRPERGGLLDWVSFRV